MTDTPRIYVACLAAYNHGRLHGQWIDADTDVDVVHEEIEIMLAKSPVSDAAEWAIHDYEGFYAIHLSESMRLDEVCALAALVGEHGALGAAVYGDCGDLEETKTALEDRYDGEYDSLTDYAQQWLEDTTEIPDHLANYIDYEKLGRDLRLGGDVTIIELCGGGVHVFRSH